MTPGRRALIATALLVGLAMPGAVLAGEQPAPTPPADGELARVVEVTDGDTIRIERHGGSVERLRYIGIDTPETVAPGQPVEPWGPQATAANEELVADRLVLLERDVSERDRFDRLLRYVWVETPAGWLMVNGQLVAQGLARVRAYEPDTKHDAWLRQLEAEARQAGLGLHGPPAPEDGEPDLLERLLDWLFGT